MKKILFTTLCFALMTASFAQTTHPAKAKKQANTKKTATTTKMSTNYHCPMKCENDKKYSQTGTCGKCGMDLVKVLN